MSTKKEKEILSPLAENEANEQEAEKPAKKNKVLGTVINVVLVFAIILAVLATYVSYVSTSGSGVPSVLGLRLFSIQTDSMYDTLMPGAEERHHHLLDGDRWRTCPQYPPYC